MSVHGATALRNVLQLSDAEFEAIGLRIFQKLLAIGIALQANRALAQLPEIRTKLSATQLFGLNEIGRIALELVERFPDAPMPEVAVALRDLGFFEGYQDIELISADTIEQLRGALLND